MFNTFTDCFRALLEDDNLDAAKGGLVSKLKGQFIYSLHGEPEGEGEPFLGVYPSATPEVKWRVMYHDREAEGAYREFTSNPDNGELIAA
ncbi:MAG TPA: hypothetical protein VKC61_13130 [Pyrinomonadaceae bacterium]|nr:hypothetical protein [Pyrinomonadaceae bacterium]